MMRRVAIITIAGAPGLIAAASAMEPARAAAGGRAATWDDFAQSRSAGTPVMAIVSLKAQRVTIYDADGPILRSSVSTGQTGYETPVGTYSVLQKEAEHYSNRYDDASMPFLQGITWSGVALHAGALPGYPASHGCIRLPYEFAEHLFDMTKVGMRVIVARNDVAPAAISHPFLFKPRPMPSDVALATETADRTTSSDVNDPTKLGAPRPEEPTAVFSQSVCRSAGDHRGQNGRS
jgi:L,D-transpeptidase-like protein